MSRVSKWKLEKTKVKVVFRLQFHATHIPQTGWDKLFISFIPADTGKPTAKTTKANVRNGSCKWGDPIYETTRLLQDSKTKLYDEKLYKFVVAMGSSRSSILGEAIINLADYVDASKPIIAAIPLQGCNFGTVLHITVQLLTSKTGFREFEQQREQREKGLQSGGDSASDEQVRARIKLKADASELSSLEEEANVNEEYADSATGHDGSSETSGSLYAEKQGTSSGDLHALSQFQSPPATKEDLSVSVHGCGSNNSTDNELAVAFEENNRLRGSLELAESSLFELKLEVSSLQNVADELGAETQKLSNELAAEISSAEELAKEVSVMKSECVKFKDDINGLKDLKLSTQIPLIEANQFSNAISVVEGKIRELQRKASLPNDGETKFIHLELDSLLDFLQDFKLGNSVQSDLKIIKTSEFESGNGFGLDLIPPETILHHLTSSPPVSDVVNPHDAMKAQIFDLVRELDEAKVEKEGLIRKMDQMECYYEALIHELEENQKRLVGELQLLRTEHSTCLYALSVSKTEVESLREEMNRNLLQFVQERRDLEGVNIELERRATTSEAALRRARLNYSIAVDKLQKDLELLSSQVTSMFEANESLIKQALPLQTDLQNQEDGDAAKLTNQMLGLRKRSNCGDVLLEDLKRSVSMQEELYRKVEEELVEMYSISLNLEIYSKALEESLCEANCGFKMMKGEMSELVQELTSSTASERHLMLRLQKASDEIRELNEYKSSSVYQCSEMALQNQLLEDKLESILLEFRSLESKYAACSAENAEILLQLEQEAFENEKLVKKISHLEEESKILLAESDELVSSKRNLEESIKFVQDKLANLLLSYNEQFGNWSASKSLDLERVDIKEVLLQFEEIQHSVSMRNRQLIDENRNLKSKKASADVSLGTVRSEILSMKEKFKIGVQDMVTKLDISNALVEKLQCGIESVANKLELSSEIELKFSEQNEVLLADFTLLEDHLAREISNLDLLAEEIGRSKVEINELMRDKEELSLCLNNKTEESTKLSYEVNSLKEDLKTLRDELHDEKASSSELEQKVRDLELEKSRLAHLLRQQNESMEELTIKSSHQESLESELLDMHDHSIAVDVQLVYVSSQYEALLDELLQKLASSEVSIGDLRKRYHDADSMLSHSLAGEANLRLEKDTLLASLESLRSDLEVYEAQNKLLSESNKEIRDQLEESNRCMADLQKRYHDTESTLTRSLSGEANWRDEKDSLLASLESLRSELEISEAQNKLLSESNNEFRDKLDESNRCLADLQKRCDETESMLSSSEDNLTKEKNSFLASLESLRSELEVSEADNKLLSESNKEIRDQLEESKGCLTDLLKRFSETESMLNLSLSNEANLRQEKDKILATLESLKAELEASEAQNKLLSESNIEIRDQLRESNRCLGDLQKRHDDNESTLNRSLAGEADLRGEKDSFLVNLESLRSDLEVSEAQNKLLSESNIAIRDQLEEANRCLSMLNHNLETVRSELEVSEAQNKLLSQSNKELRDQFEESNRCLGELQKRYNETELMFNRNLSSEDKWREEKDSLLASLEILRSDLEVSEAQNKLLSSELLRLQNMITDTDKEMSDLILSRDELEVLTIVLKGKVYEQNTHITLLESYKTELITLRFQFNELSKKLGEQVLKTEEFKNLSIHLKELKDKAEAECVAAREKGDNEFPTASQDSLRVAFIKEQYETKVQELKQQLAISKKHGEEMLIRLQDAIDEIENRKKSEAVGLKRNEELSTRLSALEAELLSAISEKREKNNAFDRTKAELECALLSLECCKEEKEKLGASLVEFEAEKSNLANELSLVKGELEDLKSLRNLEKDEYGSECKLHSRNGSVGDSSPVILKTDNSAYGIQGENFVPIPDRENAVPTLDGESEDSTESIQSQTPRDPLSNGKISDVANEILGAQKLRSSIERLHEELEKMKNENTVFDDVDPDFQANQREIMQLHKANEELRSMFPLFDEISSGGNALDRVFALEIELAEALKVKNKSNTLFQSSFLKQHSNEEAIFKSFRDINELIKEMLELKGKHASMEAELRDMHDRYSQLSLQFAEVEGERQKLKMTLKNVRSSKRLVPPLNRSSSDNVMDHS